MMNKAKKMCFMAVLLFSFAAIGAIPEPMFVCDYDSPARLDGTVLPISFSEDRITKGRFGKGFHFARRSENRFPYSLSSLATNVSSGVFEVKDLRLNGETRWRAYFRDAHVASAWVKGRRGARLEMKFDFSHTRSRKKAVEEKWKNIVKSRDKTATDARYVEDEKVPASIKLTGAWQRVAVYSFLDVRTCNGRRGSISFATSDSSPFKLCRLQYEVQSCSPRDGDNPSPSIWIEGGRSSEPTACCIDFEKHGKSFPYDEGSLSLWVKYPQLSNLRPTFHQFVIWDRIGLGEKVFSPGRGMGNMKSPVDMKDPSWQHIAFTWTTTNVVVYRNGREFSRKNRARGKGPAPKSRLCIGGAGWQGLRMSGFILDDIALFDKTLTPSDVDFIASSKKSIASSGRKWFIETPGCTMFPRNEKDARFTLTLYASKKCKGEFNLKVGGLIDETVEINLNKGVNLVTVPFDARVFPVGKVPFSLTGLERTRGFSKNIKRLSYEGMFEILPRFDRQAFRVFNWGGGIPIPEEYALEAGMNVMHLHCGVPNERLDSLQRKGVHYALNLGNFKDAFNTGFDEAKIKERLTDRLRRHAGRANWSMTMTSTEAAGIRNTDRSINMPKWVDFARKSLGRKPKAFICGPAFSLKRPKDWEAPSDGVIDRDDDLDMLLWAEREGDPVLQVNRMDREVVHSLSPGNLVWAEPSCPYGVDMTAYWAYEYPLDRIVSRLKRSYDAAREVGTAFMPTLGMGSCPKLMGSVPGCDGKVQLAHTYEEMLLKTYTVMGVTRANAMSYFDLCGWSEGEKYAEKPVSGKMYAEKGVGRRFGDKMRKDLVPAFMLLKDMDTYDSPNVAIVLSETTDHTSGILWTYRGYIFDVTRILFDVIPECTILRDSTIGRASRFRHVFLPSASSVLRNNYNALMKASRGGTVIYTDFLCRQSYPSAVRFDDGKPKKNYINNYNSLASQMGPSFERLRELAEKIRLECRSSSPAFVEKSDGTLRVYSRHLGGKCNTFLCVNDTRRPGPFSTYRPEAPNYLPYGKACSSVVSLKVPEGSIIYDFFTSKTLPYEFRGGRAFVKLDLGPAEAALLCVYPSRLTSLSAEFKETDDPREGVLKIELRDDAGKVAKGRQLANVKISDASGVRDESGVYTLVDGVCSIPIYFPIRGKNVKLKAEVAERVSGLGCTTEKAFQ